MISTGHKCEEWKVENYNDIKEDRMEVIEKIHEDLDVEKNHEVKIVDKTKKAPTEIKSEGKAITHEIKDPIDFVNNKV